jgi:predicted nucleotidyltransferase
MARLTDFMISRVRERLYAIFFDNPNEMFYVRELTRSAGEEINAVRRELNRMERNKIIKSEKRSNRLYYYLRQDYDFFEDLLGMITKSAGLGLQLRKAQTDLGKIRFVMFSGAFVRRKKRAPDDVDVLVVGELNLERLSELVKAEEKRLKTEINYTVMTDEEFIFRKQRRDPFLLTILSKSRFMIIGDEEGLVDRKEA